MKEGQIKVDPMRIVHVNLKDWRDGITKPTQMTLEQEGFYWRMTRQIYEHGGGIIDDDLSVSRWLLLDIRVYRRLKLWLIAIGKIFLRDGFICNERVDREMRQYQLWLAQAKENGRTGASARWSQAGRYANSNQSAPEVLSEKSTKKSNEINTRAMHTESLTDTGSKNPKVSIGGESVTTREETSRSTPQTTIGFQGKKVTLSVTEVMQIQATKKTISVPKDLIDVEARVLEDHPRLGPEALKNWFNRELQAEDNKRRAEAKSYNATASQVAEAREAVQGESCGWRTDGSLEVVNGFKGELLERVGGDERRLRDVLDRVAPYVGDNLRGFKLKQAIKAQVVKQIDYDRRDEARRPPATRPKTSGVHVMTQEEMDRDARELREFSQSLKI